MPRYDAMKFRIADLRDMMDVLESQYKHEKEVYGDCWFESNDLVLEMVTPSDRETGTEPHINIKMNGRTVHVLFN